MCDQGLTHKRTDQADIRNHEQREASPPHLSLLIPQSIPSIEDKFQFEVMAPVRAAMAGAMGCTSPRCLASSLWASNVRHFITPAASHPLAFQLQGIHSNRSSLSPQLSIILELLSLFFQWELWVSISGINPGWSQFKLRQMEPTSFRVARRI